MKLKLSFYPTSSANGSVQFTQPLHGRILDGVSIPFFNLRVSSLSILNTFNLVRSLLSFLAAWRTFLCAHYLLSFTCNSSSLIWTIRLAITSSFSSTSTPPPSSPINHPSCAAPLHRPTKRSWGRKWTAARIAWSYSTSPDTQQQTRPRSSRATSMSSATGWTSSCNQSPHHE